MSDRDSKFIIISRSTRDDYRANLDEWPSSEHLSLVDFSVATVTHRANKNLCCSGWLSVGRQIIVQRCIQRRVETSNSADSIVASSLVPPPLPPPPGFCPFFCRDRVNREASHYVRTMPQEDTPASIKKNRICMRATRTELRGRNILEPALPLCR